MANPVKQAVCGNCKNFKLEKDKKFFNCTCAACTHMIIPTPTFIVLDFNLTPILPPRFPPMRTAMPVATIKGISNL